MEICTSDTDYFRSIDGNWISKPVGYCTYHRGYVSERQARVHKCHRKHGGTCGRLANMEGRLIKRMNQQQFYDKMISRLDKMCASLDKIVRTLEAMQKVEFNKAMTISVTDKNGDPVVLHKHAESKDE